MKKICLLIALIQGHVICYSQDQSDISVTFNHVAISVQDVDQSAEYYMKTLNLKEITNKTKIDGIRWFSLGEGKELHIISILKDKVATNKAVHFALTTSTFDAFIKNLKELNIPFSDWPGTPNKVNIRADGVKQVFLKDPDGYWIEVNSVAQND